MDIIKQFWNYDDYFDDNVRQVLDALDESGERDNTQIIYTSDHGDLLGNHGMWCKSCMYEDAVGIPMTLIGPGITLGVNETPVSLADIASTITSFVLGETVAQKNGEWCSRPLQWFIDSPESERPILSEYHDGGSPCGFFMIRKGRWKYVYFAENNPSLLFDMEADPLELKNHRR